MTLRQWQQTVKPREELLYNCSEFQHLNDEWVPFSIGMGWSVINYAGNLDAIQIGSHKNTVFCAVRTHTDHRRRSHLSTNRSKYVQTLANNSIHNTNIEDTNQYFTTLPTYKFVISPEGNGIDCHRHYEALMAGCIPIIEEHDGIREKYAGCPILWTKDYSEITESYLQEKYNEMIDREYDFSKVLFNSYPKEVQEQMKENGNYWSFRLTGRKWYT